MALALDPATEQRIQRELARGPYREPAELINHALDLLDDEFWLHTSKSEVRERIEESFAAVDRGETHTPEQARSALAKQREQH